jgi:hypothetical protein
VEIHGLGETAPLIEQAVPHRRGLEKAVDSFTVGALEHRRHHRRGQPLTLAVQAGGQHPQVPIRRSGSGHVDGPLVLAQPLPLVFFDSYEAAMKNSALPETDALSKKFMGLADGAPSFHNLDVVDDRE